MTKKEFEDRTGYIVPDDRFKEIETMYLEAGEDIDKDTFCKDFKSTTVRDSGYAVNR